MKYWAKIDKNNLVTRVLVLDDAKSHDWLIERFGGNWILASNDEGITKKYAAVGFTYSPELSGFIPPKPFNSWILNSKTCRWEAPVTYPEEGNDYTWDEDSVSWVLVEKEI